MRKDNIVLSLESFRIGLTFGDKIMTIEDRLERLEQGLSSARQDLSTAKRRNRFLLFGLVVLGIAWAVTITTGSVNAQSTADSINAKELLLVDSDGYTRARLGMDETGPSLSLYDQNFIQRVMLGIDEYGPLMGLYDDLGIIRAGMAVDSNGPLIALYSEIADPIWGAP
jgi:hypothetical protein